MNFTIVNGSFNHNISGIVDTYIPDLLTGLGVLCVVFSVGIIFTNGLIIVTVLSSATLRTQLRNQLIVNICLVDLLQGLIVYPVYAHGLIGRGWSQSCKLATFMYFGFVHADTFLIMWLLVTQDLLYLTKQLRLDLPVLSNRSLILVRTFWNGLPWFLLFIVLVPLVMSGFDDSSTNLCMVYGYNSTLIHASSLDFFLPALIMLMLVVCFTVFHTCAKPQIRFAEESLLNEPEVLEHPICYIVPSLLVVLLNFLDQFFTLYISVTDVAHIDLDLILPLALSSTVMEAARCAILPLIWLLLPDVRLAVKILWTSLLQKATTSRTEQQTVSYTKDGKSQ